MPDDTMIGHNQPPSPVEALLIEIEATSSDLTERASELAGGAERCVVNDDDTASRATLLAKQINEAIKVATDRQKAAKEPYRVLADAAFNWFKPTLDKLDTAKRATLGKLDAYRRQREAEAEAKRKAAEDAARKAAEEAAKAKTLDDAFDAKVRLEAAQAQAAAVVVPEVRSAYGHVATGRKTWDYEVANAEAVPRHFLQINHDAIRAHMKARQKDKPPTPIPGITFFEKTTTVVR